MSTPIPQPTSGWEVLSQTPDTDTSTPGRLVDGVRITFRTGTGVTDSVFVANERYGDVGYVRARIGAKVAQHDQVSRLSEPGR